VIYRARKRYKWPGVGAAVVVSVVHVHKGMIEGPYTLDGRAVDRITAYLFHAGGSEDPKILVANEGKSFQGSIVLGMGFTFDDTDKKGVASTIAEMHRLIAKDPRNAGRIFPYIGGKELNDSPTHAHHRYVINFEDFPLRRKETGHSWFSLTDETQRSQLREGIVAPDYPGQVAEDWPDLFAIVAERVKPIRAKDKRENYRDRWWRFAENRPGLTGALRRVPRTIAISRVSQLLPFAFLPSSIVPAESLVAITLPTYAAFAAVQSRVHEVWTRIMASTLEDRIRYTPDDCFKSFPFPNGFESNATLEAAGQAYYDFRAALIVRKNKGMTKIYSDFHDPGEMSNDIVELRRLHDVMDRAVLDAYGWTLPSLCDFFLDFDVEDSVEEKPSKKKKHFRYRWPDEFCDEILAKLLVLNQERYEEEVLAGLHDKVDGSRGRRRMSDEADETGEDWDEDQGEFDL